MLANAYPFLKPWLVVIGLALLWPTFLLLRSTLQEWKEEKEAQKRLPLLLDLENVCNSADFFLNRSLGSFQLRSETSTSREYEYLVQSKYKDWFVQPQEYEKNARLSLLYKEWIKTDGYETGLRKIKQYAEHMKNSNES